MTSDSGASPLSLVGVQHFPGFSFQSLVLLQADPNYEQEDDNQYYYNASTDAEVLFPRLVLLYDLQIYSRLQLTCRCLKALPEEVYLISGQVRYLFQLFTWQVLAVAEY